MILRIVCGQDYYDLHIPDDFGETGKPKKDKKRCLSLKLGKDKEKSLQTNDKNNNDGKDNEKQLEKETDEEKWNVLRLKCEIEKITQVPVAAQKIIHRGKSLQDDSAPLSALNVRNKDKIMVLGKKHEIDTDTIYKHLADTEKTDLEQLKITAEKIQEDLEYLEAGYLAEGLLGEASQKLDKRLRLLNERCMRLLETLDALDLRSGTKEQQQQISTVVDQASTSVSDCQLGKNREKRKQIVDSVQEVLKFHDQLDERRLRLTSNDPESPASEKFSAVKN